jgi:hypothetical protein
VGTPAAEGSETGASHGGGGPCDFSKRPHIQTHVLLNGAWRRNLLEEEETPLLPSDSGTGHPRRRNPV